MVDYPSVNWWPGNLRPYESRLSFLARFAKLNGLGDRACLNFLKVDAEDGTSLPVDEIARLSDEARHEADQAGLVWKITQQGAAGDEPQRRETREHRPKTRV